jgi:DNA-binding transcriptional regulator YdaS (Cro superfamily)
MDKTLERTIKHFGSQSAVARALGLTYQAVQHWETIPTKWALEIEKKTDGKITAREVLEAAASPPGISK